nr:MAG TPA: Nucleotide modification associated domain 1 [Caudoviricetes sp.]
MNQDRVFPEIPPEMCKTDPEQISIYDVHRDILQQLHNTYLNKNHDYGNSFHKVREEFPHAVLIRLMDKLERLKVLYFTPAFVGESIEDTLLDLANYAIMEVVERRMSLAKNK